VLDTEALPPPNEKGAGAEGVVVPPKEKGAGTFTALVVGGFTAGILKLIAGAVATGGINAAPENPDTG
jgi:hypothetical protein